ncbi:MAG: DUF5522 domain-containing protein [Pyrinomonadaceae bacterium]
MSSEQSTLIEGEDFYMEGAAFVFTARYHLRRGYCCENSCRHCPYGAAVVAVADDEEGEGHEVEKRVK